jgi:hypothetical protein
MKRILLMQLACFLCMLANGQSVELDQRAKSHYSPEQIASLSPVKIAQINFYYQRSFEVKKGDKACANCTNIDPATLDITRFENQRAADRRVVVFVSTPGWPIVLLSLNELEQEYKRIANGQSSTH